MSPADVIVMVATLSLKLIWLGTPSFEKPVQIQNTELSLYQFSPFLAVVESDFTKREAEIGRQS